MDFLDDLLTRECSRLGRTFAVLLEIMIDLSKGTPTGKGYGLSPVVVSSFSSALKVLVKALRKR